MTSSEIRKKYLEFFEKKGHKAVPSASLVPANDPTTLFTSAGMQPMIPYLLGEPHPEGKRVVDSQLVFRSSDIEEVGDRWHNTLFEMLGNWSFGDYFKKEQLEWAFEFLTEVVGIDPNRLYVSAFIGDLANNLPKDEEAVKIWQELFAKKGIDAKAVDIGSVKEGNQHGIQGGRIFYYDSSKNWWSRSGQPKDMPAGEPGGPDSEIFYEFTEIGHDPKFGPECHPNCDCGRFVELGNSVFMQYLKNEDGSFKELPNKNIDFGGSLERISAVSQNLTTVFESDNFWPIIERLQEQLGFEYSQDTANFRIIADHIKAAAFLINAGILPSNKLQGYVLRRLLRRAAIKINQLKENSMVVLPKLVDPIIDIYSGTDYFQTGDWDNIRQVIEEEINKFQKTIKQGLKEIGKVEKIDGKTAFNLYQTYGFPIEITAEIVKERGQDIDMDKYKEELERHRQLSQTTSAGMFKGGLADQTEQTKKLHTATHMLQAPVKRVLGPEVGQRGSNITAGRLRWDFNYPKKLTDQQIKQIEGLVNENIQKDLKVWFDVEDRDQAIKEGATTNHGEQYPDKVKVYKIGNPAVIAAPDLIRGKQSQRLTPEIAVLPSDPRNDELFSQELCGGPHVEHTGILGKFKITKEEGISAGIRRIYATIS